jgi:hypothetical protein
MRRFYAALFLLSKIGKEEMSMLELLDAKMQPANVRRVDALYQLRHEPQPGTETVETDAETPTKPAEPAKKKPAKTAEPAKKKTPDLTEPFILPSGPTQRTWWHFAGALLAVLVIIVALCWMLFYYP